MQRTNWYYDYNISDKKLSREVTILGIITPLFFRVASPEQAQQQRRLPKHAC